MNQPLKRSKSRTVQDNYSTVTKKHGTTPTGEPYVTRKIKRITGESAQHTAIGKIKYDSSGHPTGRYEKLTDMGGKTTKGVRSDATRKLRVVGRGPRKAK